MGEHNLAKMEPAGGDMKVDTDRQHANEIRQEAKRVLDELVSLQDKATRYGLLLNFQIGRNAIGLHMLNDLTIMKIMMP